MSVFTVGGEDVHALFVDNTRKLYWCLLFTHAMRCHADRHGLPYDAEAMCHLALHGSEALWEMRN